MALFGISSNPKPNKLASDNFEGLPLPIFKGSLSLSMSFEGFPTGTISAESISEEEIDLYRQTYQVGFKFILLGNLFMEVGSYAETEDLIYVSLDSQIRTYNVNINLRSANEIRSSTSVEVRSSTTKNEVGFGPNLTINGRLNASSVADAVGLYYSGYSYVKTIEASSANFTVNFSSLIQEQLRLNLQILDWHGKIVRSRNYRSGSNWLVSTHDINYSVETSSQLQSQYRNTVLSGKDGLPFLSDAQLRELTLKELLGENQERKTPVELTTKEGDTDPDDPPYDVRKLRNIDMNFDFSGPRKTLKKTTTRNGQPFIEEIFTYGFAYLAQDIRNPAAEDENQDISIPALKSDSPENWWDLIEYQKTEYIYKEGEISASVQGIDENGQKYLGRIVGSRLFSTLYLTEIKTTGWKLARFQQERFDEFGTDQDTLDSRWLVDEINTLSALVSPTEEDLLELSYAQANLFSITFRRTPFESRTQYYLVPATDIYDNLEQTPFQTQFVSKESLGETGDGNVLIAVPDPSYNFPLKVLEERTLTQSFDQMDHPENIIIRKDRGDVLNDTGLTNEEKQEALKELKLLPSLTTGEDTFRSILREVLPSKNTKKNKNVKKETDLYQEFESNASHNDHNFQYSLQEKVFRTITGQLPDATVFNYEFEDEDSDEETDDFEYRISTTDRSDLPVFSESMQYETNSLEKAKSAAICELELDNFLSSTDVNLNLAWFYPDIRPGDYITVIDDGSKENLRVKNVNLDIQYQGYVNGELLKTSSGTNLTCGIMPIRSISTKRVRKDASDSSLEIKTTIQGADIFGSTVVPSIRTRRNPSGDAFEEETGRRL